MKKFTSLLFAGLAFFMNAMAQETVVSYSFDNASSPELTAGSNNNLDYTHTSVISGTTFLNIWGENNTTSPTVINLTENDLTEKGQWTLEFDWAGYGGCNKKEGHTIIAAGNVTLLDIYDKADWNNTFDIKYSGATTPISVYACNKSNRISAATGDALNTATNWYHFTVVGNAAGVILTVQQYTADKTLGKKILEGVTINATNVSPTAIKAHPGSCAAVAIDELKLYTENVSVETANYTVKYTTADGTEIRTSETREGVVGNNVVLLGTDKEFVVDETKYLYVSDNTATDVIALDGSTVITVVLRPAEVWTYSVIGVNGVAVATGKTYENTTVTVGYPRYQLVDGVLYEAPKTNDSKKQYNCTIEVTSDGAVYNMTYSKVAENIVYYEEAENMEGLTKVTYGNVGVRASNSLAAKATEDTKIVTLPAGKYVVSAGVFSSAKTPAYVIKIGVGENVYEAPVTAVNNSEVKSAEYELAASSDVVLYAEGMGDNNALDYLYIQKTGEYVAPAIELPISNLQINDWSSYDGPIQVGGIDADGNFITIAFFDGVIDPEYCSYSDPDMTWYYAATEATGTLSDTEEATTLDATVTFENGKTYHITGTYVKPVWTLGDPEIKITPTTLTIVYDVTSISEGCTVSMQPSISLTVGEDVFDGGCGETYAVDGVVTFEIPVQNLYSGYSINSPELEAGDKVTISFNRMSVYKNFTDAPYETVWDAALSKTYEVTVTSDVTDGIKTVDASAKKNVMFNLAGQRVNNAKGIVIMNGKKVVK